MRTIPLLIISAVAGLMACDVGSDPVGVEPAAARLSQAPEPAAMAPHTFAVKQASSGHQRDHRLV